MKKRLFISSSMILVFALLTVLSTRAMAGDERPSIRVITFNGDNAWEAAQTIYKPIANNRYHTDVIEALFKSSSDDCADLLSQHQKRALDIMLKNRYITRELYSALTDPRGRAHKLSQYILATSFLDLTPEEVKVRGIKQERILEELPNESGKPLVRVHVGSLFFVRGYELERKGSGTFQLKQLPLPWQVGQVPASLKRPLDRTHLTAAAEIGRALIEEGASRDEFPRLMQILGSALAADARVLNLDAKEFALFGHSFDAQHLRLFSLIFPARPLTPEMQSEVESNPREFLAHYQERPMPGKNDWKQFEDAIAVGSLEALKTKWPADLVSEMADKLKDVMPGPGENRLAFIRDFSAALRQDYDYKWYDPHRPGHRKPVQIRDFGTPLLLLNLIDAMEKQGVPRNDENISRVLKIFPEHSVNIDPDFAQQEWFERNFYFPMPHDLNAKEDFIPAMIVSNLDPGVPSKELPQYLGSILLAASAKIENRLRGLNHADLTFVHTEMSKIRVRKNLSKIGLNEINLATFLETYDLIFASADPIVKRELPILGGSPLQGLRVRNNGKSGKVDIHLDLNKLGIDIAEFQKNPAAFQSILQKAAQTMAQKYIFEAFEPTTVYRFKMEEVLEQRQELPDAVRIGAHHILQDGHHRQKIQRLYITSQ